MRFLVFIAVFPLTLFSQSFWLQKICDLPDAIEETSGLVYLADGTFLTINDKGNDPIVYQFNKSGQIVHSCYFINATNTDWESIALKDDSSVVVGDFGNNKNDRQDLRLYLAPLDSVLGHDTLEVDTAWFAYDDQEEFPPDFDDQNYDCEASFYLNDTLYQWSKDRTIPYEGTTKLYGVRPTPGPHTSRLIAERMTSSDYDLGSITGAAYDSLSKKMVWMTYGGIWIFENSTQRPFFNDKPLFYEFEEYGRREGVTFDNGCGLYFTQEAWEEDDDEIPAALYHIEICGNTDVEEFQMPKYWVEGNQIKFSEDIQYQIYDVLGREQSELMKGLSIVRVQIGNDFQSIQIYRK